jgi:hypothetical protein
MHDSPALLQRPGVYHPMFLSGPQTPAQATWLDETCVLVEAFVAHADLDFEARSAASLAVHLAADFLFVHFEHAARWSQLEPGALAARLPAEIGDAPAEILWILSAFFRFLVISGRVAHARGQYVACYFESLAALNATARRPSRRDRRVGARRARALTAAR